MRTVATFRSSAFNTSELKPYFINPGCFGDDLARWLIARFRAAGVSSDAEPGQEDFGWYFNFAMPDGSHDCIVGLRPGDSGADPEWVIWTERREGLLPAFFDRRKRVVTPSAVALLHGVLAAAPEITDLRWHDRDDFDAGREDETSATP